MRLFVSALITSEHRVINRRKFQGKIAWKIACAERVVSMKFFFPNMWHTFSRSSGPRSNKTFTYIFMRTRPAYLEILSSRWLNFSHPRESSRDTLVKPFDHTRNNVAIHPYFHVLYVISLSVSYGSALFTGTKSTAKPTVSHNPLLTAVKYYRSRHLSNMINFIVGEKSRLTNCKYVYTFDVYTKYNK